MSVITQESILVKGSPDHVMAKVTHYQESDGTISVMTEAKKSEIFAVYGHMAENALRVLACAYRANDQDNYETELDVERDLIFIGLVGMIDPPRDEVKDAVKKCHSAGIRTIIITGDYGPTAAAIGRELGMVQGDNLKLLTGAEVETMNDKEL
ncbi:HAD family hydrolase [Candidatus Peribacteria bacterium]|nr:HAD family hydrolase [Candidatus Peribacteria bacterium]